MEQMILTPKRIDLLFVVDVTASMGGLIQEAKNKMRNMLEKLSSDYTGIHLKVGFSFFRDHPPEDTTFVTSVFDLDEMSEISKTLNNVTVDGGGDIPEAVFDGIIDGVEAMSWRNNSRRIAFLLGDAPPHGMVNGESCCMCGKSWGDVVQILTNKNVTLYAINVSNSCETSSTFKTLATFGGGMLIQDNGSAMDAVLSSLASEFDDIDVGSKVLELMSSNMSAAEICEMLNIDRNKLEEVSHKMATV